MTLRETFTKALLARGWRLVKMTYKYDVFALDENPLYLYVGRSGALRQGSTVQSSLPCNERFRQTLIEEARR